VSIMESTNKTKIEVVYKKAKLGKRMLAYFIDIGLLFLSTFILFSIINIPVTHSKWFKNKENELTEIKNDSGLYINGINLVDYYSNNTDYSSFEEKKNALSNGIDNFYTNQTYIDNIEKVKEDYNVRKLSAQVNGVNLFLESDGSVIENSVSAELLYNFYVDEYSNYTLGYLIRNTKYFYLTRFSFLTSAVEFISIFTFVFTVFFLVFPLTFFKRGRQTIGMKLEKIGLISVRADNVTSGKYVLRFFFNYFVFFVLNFVSFLIPSIVSISMMFISKTNSNLPNYVFNDYAVDVSDKNIYLNALEREEAEFKLQEISIENRDLTLK